MGSGKVTVAIRWGWLALAGLLVLPTGTAQADTLTRLSGALPGFYDNMAQWEAAGRPGATDQSRHVRMNADIVPADVPWLEGKVFYLQQIQDDFAPHVFRQGLLILRAQPDGTARMTLRGFRNGDIWIDAHLDPGRLSALTEADLLPADPGCDLIWRPDGAGFLGETAPGACGIDSVRLGVRLDRSERWTLTDGALTHYDRVTKPDGGILHESPQGKPFVLERWPAATPTSPAAR